MHPNTALLHRLFGALDKHDHSTMASCYHPAATFRDIAFDLRTRREIHSMWHMVCEGDIRVTFDVVQADDQAGCVALVDTYTFGARPSTKERRPVRNVVDSYFRFEGGLIVEQDDICDARQWAKAAIGGVAGFLAGRIHILRRMKAQERLQAFVDTHPEYR